MQQLTPVSFCAVRQPGCCGLSCPLVPAAPSASVASPLPLAPTRTPRSCRPLRLLPRATLRPYLPAGHSCCWGHREWGFRGEGRQEGSPWGGGVRDVVITPGLSWGSSPRHLHASPRATLPAARPVPHSLPVCGITPNR